MTLRNAWKNKESAQEVNKAMREQAEAAVRARDQAMEQRMADVHERAMRQLAREHEEISREKRAQPNLRRHHEELLGISDRMARDVRQQQQRHNGLLGRVERLFGGKNRQQARVDRIETRARSEMAKRSQDYDRREGRRQTALHQRLQKIEHDQRERQRDYPAQVAAMKAQRAAGFDHAVKQEMNRIQQVRRQGRSR